MTQRERFGVDRTPLNKMKLLLLLICSFLLSFTGCEAAHYAGREIGALSELEHGVKGVVYAVDSRTIHIKGFSYDGQAPDAFFYTGTSGEAPHDKGIIIPDENGGTLPLGPYRNKDVTLTLPDGLTLKDVPWIAVWCREYTVNFGHVKVPRSLDYPRPQKVDALPTFNHGVSSDKIVVVDAQTFLIPNFSYDGLAPDAFFWVGKGKPDTEGIRVPDENGSLEPLKKYSGKTIVITLPGDLTVFDIDYLGVWCRAFFVDFGHVVIPKNLNVPPSLKMLGVAPQRFPGNPNLSPSLSPFINDIGHKPLSQPVPPISHQPGTPPLLDNQNPPGPLPQSPPPSHPFLSHQALFLNQGARPQSFPQQQFTFHSQNHINNPALPPPPSQLHFQNFNSRPIPHSFPQGSHRVPLGNTINQIPFHSSQNQIRLQQFPPQLLPQTPHSSSIFHKSELKFALKGDFDKASAASLSGVKPVSLLSPSGSALQRPAFSPQPLSHSNAHAHAHAHSHAPVHLPSHSPSPIPNPVVSKPLGQSPLVFPNSLAQNQRFNQNAGITSHDVPIYFPSHGNSDLQHIPYRNEIHSPSLNLNNHGVGFNNPLHETNVSPSFKHISPVHINRIPNGESHLADLKSEKDFNSQIKLHQPSINHPNNFPQFNTAFRQRFPPIGGPRPLQPVRPVSGQIVNSPVNFIPDHFRIQSNVGPVRRNFGIESGTLERKVSFDDHDNLKARSRV